MWLHLTHKKTRDKQVVASLDGYDPADYTVIELHAEPTEFQDVVEGVLVTNTKREADTLAGSDHIEEAHFIKYIEALMIKSGIDLKMGLLAQEADLQNRDIQELASDVMSKRKEFEEVELERQAAQFEFKDSK